MKRIDEKIVEITKFVEQLRSMVPSNLEEYKSNLEKRAACERYFEKIIEAVVDLAFLFIKFKKFKIPEDDADAFNILLNNKIINDNLSTRLKDAKGMRNIIAHEYGKIDDEIVFEAITKELEKDARDFIRNIKSKYSKN